MFAIAGDDLVEPLHVTNIVALNRGVIELLPECRVPEEGRSGESADCQTAFGDPTTDSNGGFPAPVASPSTGMPW